jgi:pimeloyl-ACP methyl ester carboxylesterase
MSVFSRISAATTTPAMRARGLRLERRHAAGGWSLRTWRKEASSPESEPWLLLHGLGANAATWLPTLGLLGKDDLLVPELSVQGGTRGPRPALGVRDAVEVLSELVEKTWPGRKVTVAGVSLGGWIGVRLALARPDLVSRLLLVVPGGYRNQDWARIERTVRVDSYAGSKGIWSALFHKPPWYLRAGRPLLYLAYRTEAVAAAIATVREADGFDDAELAQLAIPVGLVWGECDLLFRVEDGRKMAAAIPGARLWTIAGAGHGVQWEKPAEFLAAVSEFRRVLPCPPPAVDGGSSAEGVATWPHPTS